MSLNKLLALQAQKKNNESPAKATPPPKPTPEESESPAEKQPASPAADSASAPKPKGLGLNLAGSGFKKPAEAPPTKTPAKDKPKKNDSIESGGFSLEDLARVEAAEIKSESSGAYDSGFADEIEATAPVRNLPPDLTKEMQGFVESVDGIYEVLHDPEMFAQAVRIIMLELQENPEYEKLIADDDVHVMIRGMRRTMGLARVKKQEKSRKGKTNKNARKKAGVDDASMALLDKLMGEGDD